jgi:hypothetical protein
MLSPSLIDFISIPRNGQESICLVPDCAIDWKCLDKKIRSTQMLEIRRSSFRQGRRFFFGQLILRKICCIMEQENLVKFGY